MRITKRIKVTWGWWAKPFGHVELISRDFYFAGPITFTVMKRHD